MLDLSEFKMNIPTIMTANEYYESDLGKPPGFLIEELIPEGRIGLLTAPSKCNKTTLAWNIALSVANGKDCIGHKILKQGKVLYILVEGSLRGLMDSFGNSDNIHVIADIDFEFERYQIFIEKLITKEQYKLIIIDSLYKATNCNIANAVEVNPFLKKLEKMAKTYNTTFLMLHHNNRVTNSSSQQDMNNVSGSFDLVRASEFTLMLTPAIKTEEEEELEMHLSKEEYMKLPRKRILRKLDYRDGGEGWDKFNLDIYFQDGIIDAYRYKSTGIRVNPQARLDDLVNYSIDIIENYPIINKGILSRELSKAYPDLTEGTITKKYAPQIMDELVKKGLIIKEKRYNYAVVKKNDIEF